MGDEYQHGVLFRDAQNETFLFITIYIVGTILFVTQMETS